MRCFRRRRCESVGASPGGRPATGSSQASSKAASATGPAPPATPPLSHSKEPKRSSRQIIGAPTNHHHHPNNNTQINPLNGRRIICAGRSEAWVSMGDDRRECPWLRRLPASSVDHEIGTVERHISSVRVGMPANDSLTPLLKLLLPPSSGRRSNRRRSESRAPDPLPRRFPRPSPRVP